MSRCAKKQRQYMYNDTGAEKEHSQQYKREGKIAPSTSGAEKYLLPGTATLSCPLNIFSEIAPLLSFFL